MVKGGYSAMWNRFRATSLTAANTESVGASQQVGATGTSSRSDFKFIEMRNCTEQGVLAKPNLSAFGNFC